MAYVISIATVYQATVTQDDFKHKSSNPCSPDTILLPIRHLKIGPEPKTNT